MSCSVVQSVDKNQSIIKSNIFSIYLWTRGMKSMELQLLITW